MLQRRRFLVTTLRNSTTSMTQQQRDVVSLEQQYVNLLKTCLESSNSRYGRAIHARLIKSTPLSTYINNHILNFYVKCGHLNHGLQVLDEMPERNVVSWSAMIVGFVQRGRSNEALALFSRMHSNAKVLPNAFTLVSVLSACSMLENSWLLYQIYGYVVRLGYESNVFLMNAFLTALIRHGKLVEAEWCFGKCLDKDTVSWNVMMAGLLQSSCLEMPGFWSRMCSQGLRPDDFSFATVLTGLGALSDLKMGWQVHSQVVKSGYWDEICVGNALSEMYIKCGWLGDGYKVFCGMPCKSVCSWTQMASGFLHCGEPSSALRIIAEMKLMGVKPNEFTLSTALNACANLASIEDGKKVHASRVKLGSQADICVDNALLDMYVKCGCMDEAQVIFQSMCERSVVSWTTMIMGCAQNGQGMEALEIFEEMRMEDVRPNYITFIGVLYACRQGGLINEAWKYFKSMSWDYGISPGEDHYACMVSLLGRAGCIKEAEELILSMPFQPGALVWQTLLGVCQLHGDVETGKRAAEHAVSLDREDPSTYVLLSNMFAKMNNWDDVGTLRTLMEKRDVRKVPGSSWIEQERVSSDPPVSTMVR